MNLIGHVRVAASISDDPLVHLGSTLPDLGAMGRFRLLGSTENERIARGIEIHHRTDDAFHSHPWFRDLQDALLARLEGNQGIARGTARAVAHVGPELLLDGALLLEKADRSGPTLDQTVDEALANIAPELDALAPLAPSDPDGWQTHLTKVAAWPRPTDYHDPAAVARRLERILSRRKRLRLRAEHVPLVADELAAVNDHIATTASALATDIATSITF